MTMYKCTEFIIEQIRSYPILYDPCHPEHRSVIKKDNIFDEIGARINETGEEIKKRWRNLKDTYVRYLKGKKSKAVEAGKVQKKYQWADHLAFLRPFLGIDSLMPYPSDIKEEIDPPTDDEDTTKTSVSSELTSPSSPPPGPHAKKRKRQSEETSSEQPSTLQAVVNYCENKRKSLDRDPMDMLFLSYASLVKTFSSTRQITVKLRIAELFAEQEHLHIDEQNISNLQNSD